MLLGFTPLPFEADFLSFSSLEAPEDFGHVVQRMLSRNAAERPTLEEVGSCLQPAIPKMDCFMPRMRRSMSDRAATKPGCQNRDDIAGRVAEKQPHQHIPPNSLGLECVPRHAMRRVCTSATIGGMAGWLHRSGTSSTHGPGAGDVSQHLQAHGPKSGREAARHLEPRLQVRHAHHCRPGLCCRGPGLCLEHGHQWRLHLPAFSALSGNHPVVSASASHRAWFVCPITKTRSWYNSNRDPPLHLVPCVCLLHCIRWPSSELLPIFHHDTDNQSGSDALAMLGIFQSVCLKALQHSQVLMICFLTFSEIT